MLILRTLADMSDGCFGLPGYDALALLGRGPREVWTAVERRSGEPVALQRLPVPAQDPGARERMRMDASRWAAVSHPHLVRVRSVVLRPDELVLVLDHAAGGSLAALVAVRPPLTAGEVVTTGAPIAEALTALHAAGLTQGGVGSGAILYTADGRPLLSDPGGAGGMLDASFARPPDDVYDLAAVCVAALAGDSYGGSDGASQPRAVPPLRAGLPRALAAALESALDPDPAARPGAHELAVALFDACPPRPVRLHPASRPAAPRPNGAPARPAGRANAAAVPPVAPIPRATAAGPPALFMVPASAGPSGLPGVPKRCRPPAPAGDEPDGALLPPPSAGAAVGAARTRATGDGAGSNRAGDVRQRPHPPAPQPPPPARKPGHRARRRTGPRTRARWRCAGAVAVAPVGLTAAVIIGIAWADADHGRGVSRLSATPQPPPAPAAAPEPTPVSSRRIGAVADSAAAADGTDWHALVRALYDARSAAFATGSPAQLGEVYAPGSPDLLANRRLLHAALAAGVRAVGIRLIPTDVRLLRVDAAGATLEVVDTLSAHTLTRTDGQVVARRPGRGAQTVTVDLVRTADGWRIERTSHSDQREGAARAASPSPVPAGR